MRSRNFWYEARVWKRQPLAVATSSTPRSFHASRSSSSSLRIVSAPISSSNILRSSEIGRGSCAASKAASRTTFTPLGLSMTQLHADGRERFGLRDLDQIFPHGLQHREEIHDEHRHAAPRFQQLAELGEPAAPQPARFTLSYRSRRRASSARGSSPSAPAIVWRGRRIRDLIPINIAAMTRYSPASSRFLVRIPSTYSMYSSVSRGMGMSRMSRFA